MDSRMRRQALFAGTIGNIMEWYDFVLYGYFAAQIAALFFPKTDALAALLSTFAVFALGFLIRPIGGIVFGRFTDRVGRRKSLIASVGLISVATVAIGMLPTYSVIGFAAPALLLVFRLVQGFAAGGEYTGALTYVVEHAPVHKRSQYAGVAAAGSYGGFVLGSLMCILMTSTTTSEQLLSWGWRVPFLAAAPLALIGLYLRLRVDDSPVFAALQSSGEVEAAPLRQAFKIATKPMLVMVGWSTACSVAYFLSVTFLISYLTTSRHFTPTKSLAIGVVTSVVALATNLVAGPVIDRVGMKRVALTSISIAGLWAIPAFLLFQQVELLGACLIVAVFAVCFGFNAVITGLSAVQLFPARVRGTAGALTYNVAFGIFGGTAPYLATWATSNGSLLPAGVYLAAFCLLGAVAAAIGIGSRSFDFLSKELEQNSANGPEVGAAKEASA
ncbi:MFS transporter [Nocardia sp. NPDC059239]|uniref:MFS transporter n=1 Tax=Nocardia sp. NPDC059239 TaxID=3346785 RepID=UPI00367F5C16